MTHLNLLIAKMTYSSFISTGCKYSSYEEEDLIVIVIVVVVLVVLVEIVVAYTAKSLFYDYLLKLMHNRKRLII